ncbi:MAG: restriction endonuclease [Gammaproteobacteria bacterium]|nr:MAG: restriction endonuclease [Gammaproteobacteria bacterium]
MLEQYHEFEECVFEVFSNLGFIPRYLQTQRDLGFDFVLTLNEVPQYAVEVKYYKSAHPKSLLIKTSAKRLLNSSKSQNISKAILVISSHISIELREELENDYQISIVDRIDLLMMSSNYPELNDKLRSLMETDEPAEGESAITIVERINLSDRNTETIPEVETISNGSDLCSELRRISKGKTSWRKYESKCEEILKYLFDGDLNGWHGQKRTDDGLNRYDLICRVKPLSEFWSFIIEDLGSRYVLFEFKNYVGRIKQGQVLTTEKYLLKKALRSVAFILSRKGADKNALLTTHGAMRENGKLMIMLDDDDLCKMLDMKDQGDDPADYLFELVDDFLMGLPR